jgi:hypothetical protein
MIAESMIAGEMAADRVRVSVHEISIAPETVNVREVQSNPATRATRVVAIADDRIQERVNRTAISPDLCLPLWTPWISMVTEPFQVTKLIWRWSRSGSWIITAMENSPEKN